MATDTDDQDFDETLKNFQLLTGISAAPSVIVPPSNPFNFAPTALEAFQDSESVVKQIFGTHCECGAERMLPTTSCSNTTPGKLNQSHSKHTTSLEHGIINPTPFKHRMKGEKKAIVRESMLKNIGKCVHQTLAKQNSSSSKQADQQPPSSSTFLPLVPTASQLKPSLSENNLTKCFNNEENDDMLDFRLLVAQCSELTLSHPSGTSKLSEGGPNFSQTSFKSLRQSNLGTFQSTRSAGNSANTRRNRRARQLKRCNSTSSLESDSSSNSGIPFGLGAAGPGGSSAGPSSTSNAQYANQQQQQSPSASSPSSSSSCSTQARLNNSMPCDITIDEMASYFETLVHIPKKMSSMAEMMYI
ncbi:oxidative stress-responsive serine-rich protein 1 [Armigeres subalbatus]|uniref:oxidative stress-responsive serine-rich protein 1 n=1 Tax=Armigeres subalbatus TaxID=124917 RepID=UPI002ED57C83